MTTSYRAIGVISGTSMDAIDVALVTTDGKDSVTRGPGASYPYPADPARQAARGAADANTAKSDPLADTRGGGDAIAWRRHHAIHRTTTGSRRKRSI